MLFCLFSGLEHSGEQIGRQAVLDIHGDEEAAPAGRDEGGPGGVDGGAAGGEGHVPADVEQRADGARGQCGRLHREAAPAAGRGGRGGGRHPGERADHED